MTVKELKEQLDVMIKMGHENTRVIANCDFTIGDIHYEKPLLYLTDVYYQSGDIELAFSDKE